MKQLFTLFADAWTPFLLQKHSKNLTTGRGIGYYFFWSFILGIVAVILGVFAFRHFTTSERILPYLDKIPAFEFQFVDNELVNTGFDKDPFVKTFEGQFQITISSTMTEIPANPQEGIYILRNGWYAVQGRTFGQKIEGGTYEQMEIGTLTLDNVIMKEKITEIYPEILAAVKTVVIVLLISLWIFITLIHLVLSFFWALVVWLVSMISGSRHLSYEESLRFVWILYPIVMIAGIFFVSMMTYFPFLISILFILAFLYNHSFGGQEDTPERVN